MAFSFLPTRKSGPKILGHTGPRTSSDQYARTRPFSDKYARTHATHTCYVVNVINLPIPPSKARHTTLHSWIATCGKMAFPVDK